MVKRGLAYIFLWVERKQLPYVTISHLVSIDRSMQSTAVCQSRFWIVAAWRMQERPSFLHSAVVFAGKSLAGEERITERVKGWRETKDWENSRAPVDMLYCLEYKVLRVMLKRVGEPQEVFGHGVPEGGRGCPEATVWLYERPRGYYSSQNKQTQS